jgi:hypothetical protein
MLTQPAFIFPATTQTAAHMAEAEDHKKKFSEVTAKQSIDEQVGNS